MKTIRSHMNDVEDQATKISVEEQMQVATIQNLTKEIDSAKSETKGLKEDSDLMIKAKGHVCSQILERQKKIALLENESSTLSQTLGLMQQERVNLSTQLIEKRTSYGKMLEDLNTKLKEHQDWLNSNKSSSKVGQPSMVNTQIDCRANEYAGTFEVQDDACKNMAAKIDAAKARIDKLTQMRSELASERHKVKQSLEKLKRTMDNYKPELRDMPIETLEEEVQALKSDKCGETEYQKSMQNQIDTIKGISHVVKCGCGEEYKVEVNLNE